MAKGFGETSKSNQQIGFTLMLWPEARAYAANQSIDDGSGEPFLGLTNMLSEAQIWKTKAEAKKALKDYLPWLIEQYLEQDLSEICIQIRLVSRNKKGNLQDQVVDDLYLSAVPSDSEVIEWE
jgi:hypothetical protein